MPSAEVNSLRRAFRVGSGYSTSRDLICASSHIEEKSHFFSVSVDNFLPHHCGHEQLDNERRQANPGQSLGVNNQRKSDYGRFRSNLGKVYSSSQRTLTFFIWKRNSNDPACWLLMPSQGIPQARANGAAACCSDCRLRENWRETYHGERRS